MTVMNILMRFFATVVNAFRIYHLYFAGAAIAGVCFDIFLL